MYDFFRFPLNKKRRLIYFRWCHKSFSEFIFFSMQNTGNKTHVYCLWILRCEFYVCKYLFTSTSINIVFQKNCRKFYKNEYKQIIFIIKYYFIIWICIWNHLIKVHTDLKAIFFNHESASGRIERLCEIEIQKADT